MYIFTGSERCSIDAGDLQLVIAAAACLVLAQTISVGWLIFRSQSIVMLKEDQVNNPYIVFSFHA